MDSIFDNIPHYINELKSDSLWEDVVVKFIFKDQKNFDTFIANIRERVDMDNLMNNQQLLSVNIISLILIGGAYYLERDRSSTPEQKTTIEVSNNKIIVKKNKKTLKCNFCASIIF